MKGVIKTYLPEKKYGFIKGDDGKDYFFHESEFKDKSHIAKLCEEAFVNFDQQATPKGYKAKGCSLINPAEVLTYIVPDEFIASRSNGVRGWDIVEHSDWIVYGTSRNSPDAAKRDVINSATRVGANAIINLEYYKTTGSEPGTGKGTYHYTIHNFKGRLVTLAKRNSKGIIPIDNLSGLNQRAEIAKNRLITKNNNRKHVIWMAGFILSLFSLATEPVLVLICFFAALIIPSILTDYGWWLKKAHITQ